MNRNFRDKLTFIISFFLLGLVRLTLIIIPFKYINKMVGNKKGLESNNVVDIEEYIHLRRVRWGVEKAALYTPWKSKCLVKAITAQILLKAKKINSTLYLGVNRADNNMEAHAWTKVGDIMITGAVESEYFTEISRFSSHLR